MKISKIDFEGLNFTKNNGLLTAVVQDKESGTVLMVGYQNEAAVEQSFDTGKVTFWSRTKEKIWVKGEESGNFLEIEEVSIDCDQDAIVYQVLAPKETCHLERFSCFGAKKSFGILSRLMAVLKKRKEEMPAGSYTTSLYQEGLDRIAQKVGEEAVEVVIASKNEDRDEFVGEASDLIFHLLVLLEQKEIAWSEIEEKLRDRVR